MTHIFIVNEKTLKIHLEYMFAGTGYANNEPDFIDRYKDTFADRVEKTYVSMIADIAKVRVGDKVAFYVTGCKKLFGFFRICSNPFFEAKISNYLGDELEKYLPLRVLIEPDEVYANGISELEALDDISNIDHPYEMCWSLIYRKLTGMRGCAFVTDTEYAYLKNKISNANNNQVLISNDYTYDTENKCIISSNSHKNYNGNINVLLDIKERLLNVSNSFEFHLQAYITQNYDQSISKFLLPNNYISNWIGNEVVCSVGEQRIDVLIISETTDEFVIRVIELKDEKPKANIINQQMIWYIKWVKQYIVPNMNKSIRIIPTIIAGSYKINCKGKRDFLDACNNYNSNKPVLNGNVTFDKLEYIKFNRNNNDISFEKIF